MSAAVELPGGPAPAGARRRCRRGGRVRRALRLCVRTIGVIVLFLVAAWHLCPFPAERLDSFPASIRIADRDGKLLRVYPSERGEFRLVIPLADMGPWLPMATVAVEDRRFYSHRGVDWLAVARAACQNVSRLRVHSGASTIPAQLVRILDEGPRTLATKAVEALHAYQLVSQRSKDELLEAYLNLAPYGGNLRGVEAAALRYFGKPARELSLGEAALVAGLPQSPSRMRPTKYLERALARRRVVLEAMAREGFITSEEQATAGAERPRIRATPWPFAAPHFSDLARASAPTTGGNSRSTLDREMQALVESRLLQFFTGDWLGRARLSAAAVVIEAASGAVRALVGSPDYFDAGRKGTLNGAVRRRSPGSALKPFTYALAYEKGILLPDSIVFDTLAVFSGFAPENFDLSFRGPVRASDALALSLNVPAVRLQSRIGTAVLLGALRRIGLGGLDRPPGSYGLTLTLGGGEVSLLELTNAYASLVRRGAFLPWTILERGAAEPPIDGTPAIAPGACELVLESLSSEAHLERALRGASTWKSLGLGYKTGTSHGFRDAWTVAFTPRYAVGVWIGDPAGQPHVDLVGLKSAAPIALEIAAELARRSPAPAPARAGLVEERDLCADTGFPPNKSCPRVVRGRCPIGCEAPPACTVHRQILVDALSGVEVCHACMGTRPILKKTVEVWPPEAALRLPLEHEAACRAVAVEGRPRILCPSEGSEFKALEGELREQKLFLSAAASSGATSLHWFVNDGLIATAPPAEAVAWSLERGAHVIRCVDDRGRGTAVRIRVR